MKKVTLVFSTKEEYVDDSIDTLLHTCFFDAFLVVFIFVVCCSLFLVK